jgi:DMSO/TMAO reductase YedYZ heme-binding membrane subunit
MLGALYLTAIIVITSLVWIDRKPHIWKWLHLLSYIVMFFVFVHALYLGTDVAHGWVRLAWLASAAGIAWVGVHRAWRSFTA